MKQMPKLLSVVGLLAAAGCAYEDRPGTTAYNTGYGRSTGTATYSTTPAYSTSTTYDTSSPSYSSSTYSTYGTTRYTDSPYATNGTYSYSQTTPGSSYLQTPSGSTAQTYSSLPNESVNTSVNAQISANPIYTPPANAPVTQVTGSDGALVSSIREQLGNYGRLAPYANTLDISSYQGAVTLNGLVNNRQDRDAIDAVIRNIQGVTSVNDHLQVSSYPTGSASSYVESSRVYAPNAAPQAAQPVFNQPAPTPGNTADVFNLHVRGLNDADRDVAQRIIQGLQTDAAVVNMMPKVNITVEKGQVFLRGNVASDQQRQQIINAVSQAAGMPVNADGLQVGSNLNYR